MPAVAREAPGGADGCLRDAEERLARCARFLDDPGLSQLLGDTSPSRFSPPDAMAKLLGENVHLRSRLEEGKGLLRDLCSLASQMLSALGRYSQACKVNRGEIEVLSARLRESAVLGPSGGVAGRASGAALPVPSGSLTFSGEGRMRVEQLSQQSDRVDAAPGRSLGLLTAPSQEGRAVPALGRSAVTLESLAGSSSDNACGSPAVAEGDRPLPGSALRTSETQEKTVPSEDPGQDGSSQAVEGESACPRGDGGEIAPDLGATAPLTLSTLQPGDEPEGEPVGVTTVSEGASAMPSQGEVMVGNTILPGPNPPLSGAKFVEGHYSVNADMFAAADSAIAASSSRLGDSMARALAKSELEAQYLRRERDILVRSQDELRGLLDIKDEECRLLKIRAEAAERRLSSAARAMTRPVRGSGAGEPRASSGTAGGSAASGAGGAGGAGMQASSAAASAQSVAHAPGGTRCNRPVSEPYLGPSAAAGGAAPGPRRGQDLDDDALLASQLQVLASIRQAVVDIKDDLSFHPQL